MALTAMEFDLLKVLVSNPNRVLTRDQLLDLRTTTAGSRSTAASTSASPGCARRSSATRQARRPSAPCAVPATCSCPSRAVDRWAARPALRRRMSRSGPRLHCDPAGRLRAGDLPHSRGIGAILCAGDRRISRPLHGPSGRGADHTHTPRPLPGHRQGATRGDVVPRRPPIGRRHACMRLLPCAGRRRG